jgi:hypothetical protein
MRCSAIFCGHWTFLFDSGSPRLLGIREIIGFGYFFCRTNAPEFRLIKHAKRGHKNGDVMDGCALPRFA